MDAVEGGVLTTGMVGGGTGTVTREVEPLTGGDGVTNGGNGGTTGKTTVSDAKYEGVVDVVEAVVRNGRDAGN